MLESWRIGKNGDHCRACRHEFHENSAFYSCLIEGADGFEREDYCPACWDVRTSVSAPGRPKPFCFWRTRRAAAPPKQVVDTGLMIEFFDRLEGADDGRKKTLRFVLALYLMRRKELKLVEIDRGDGCLIFQRRSAGDEVRVEDPSLTEQQIQETAAQLSHLLNAGLEAGADAQSRAAA